MGQLRDHHVLGWLTNFAAGFADPHGQAPHATVEGYRSPPDPAAEVRAAAGTLIGAIRGGAGTRPLTLGDAAMPGEMALDMILWEYLVHGWDLARATGQAWSPSTAAAVRSLGFAPTMLTPDYQGEGKAFAPAVTVAEDAPAIERLMGLSGRNPSWQPPSRTREEGLSGSGSVDNSAGAGVHVEAPFTMDAWDVVADEMAPGEGPVTARVVLAKTYSGPVLVGVAHGHALTTQGADGASYVAQERIIGTLAGGEGSFVLEHRASMGEGHPTVVDASIVPGSGTGALTGITGRGHVAHELTTLDVQLPHG